MKRFMIAVLLLLMSIGVSTAQATNLLLNPGFETGDLSGWTVAGTTPLGYGVGTAGQSLPNGYYAPSAVIVHGGNYAAWAETRNTYGDVLKLSQTLNIGAGDVSVGFYYGSNQGPFGNSTKMFLDGVLLSSGSQYINNGFQFMSANFHLASAGIHTLEFDLSGSGTAAVAISADDFFVNGNAGTVPVPEPGTLLLLGLGLAGLAVYGKRCRDNRA